jgi:hypothetical protein
MADCVAGLNYACRPILPAVSLIIISAVLAMCAADLAACQKELNAAALTAVTAVQGATAI